MKVPTAMPPDQIGAMVDMLSADYASSCATGGGWSAMRRRGLDPRPDNAISAATRLLHQHGGTASKCCRLPEGPAAPGAATP